MNDLYLKAYVSDILKNVNIISGKCFLKKNNFEIKDLYNYVATTGLKNGEVFLEEEVKKIVKTCFLHNVDGMWPDTPLIAEAKKLGPINTPLPFDLDYKQLIIINIMCFHPEIEVMFIATGVGGSGKSTFLNIVRQLFDNDYSPATLSDLSNSFTLAEAIKHRLICSDELAKGEINMRNLKTLVSKQPVFANPKGLVGYTVKTQSALFYCCNQVPKLDLTDSGVLRRTVYYERNTKIKNPNASLKDKKFTKEELLCFLRNALRYEMNIWFDHFCLETHKYLKSNNTVAMFPAATYESYVDMCRNAGLKPYSEPVWEEIKAVFYDFDREDEEVNERFSHNIRSINECPF